MFTTTHDSGETGTASESHVSALLARARRRGATVEATRTGGALIQWTTRQLRGDQVTTRQRRITVAPAAPVRLTPTMRADLAQLTGGNARLIKAGHANVGRITAGLWALPPATTARYLAAAVLAEGDPAADARTGEVRAPVRITLPARLALIADSHRTTTRAPRGWHHAQWTAGRQDRQGRILDRTSGATCTCGWTSGTVDDRDQAARRARDHRQEQTAAALLRHASTPPR